MHELLDTLQGQSGVIPDIPLTSKLPPDATRLSSALKRLAPSLRHRGVEIARLKRTAGRRLIQIRKVGAG